MKNIVIAAIAYICLTASADAKTFNIIDYGANTGAKTVNTIAIQKAINACSNNGGGIVYVPAGTYITGTLHLKSNINLFLESGAVLMGSPNLKDYESYTMPEYGLNYYGLLYTVKAENVSVTGQGTINGNNPAFFDFNNAKTIDTVSTQFTRQKNNYRKVYGGGIGDGPVVPKDRPRQMVVFAECKNVQVQNVSLINSPFWTMHFADCDGVNVSGIRLWSGLLVPNADGIDVTSCSNVVITGCDIRAGDDAICIGGYNHHFEIPGFNNSYHKSENIIVSNCNLQSYSSGIRVGFLDQNSVKNIHISHINITNSTRGIGLFVRDEGSLENITFSDIYIETKLRTGDWWGNGEPIHISAVRGKEKVKLGVIKNVGFNNITCVGENHILLYGSEESRLQDIRFENVTLKLENSKLNEVAGGNIDLRGCLNLREGLFANNIPGLMARYVNGLTIRNLKIVWATDLNQPYFTYGMEVSNFNNFKLSGYTGTAAPANRRAHALSLINGDGALVESGDIKKEGVTHYKAIKP